MIDNTKRGPSFTCLQVEMRQGGGGEKARGIQIPPTTDEMGNWPVLELNAPGEFWTGEKLGGWAKGEGERRGVLESYGELSIFVLTPAIIK